MTTPMSAIAWRTISTEATYAGTTEVGANNRGKLIDLWNTEAGAPLGSPWCASFAYHVLRQSGFTKKIVGAASCNNLVKYGQKHKLIVTEPQAGDLVVFAWDHVNPEFDHVGVIEFVKRTTTSSTLGKIHTLQTIEGNTKALHGRNGVFRRTRTVRPAAVVFMRFL